MGNTHELPPETQAAIAAIRFESQEQDRYLMQTSFIYRHTGLLYGLGMVMAFGSMLALMIDGYHPEATWRLWLYVSMGWLGIWTLLITAARPNSRSVFGAIFRVASVLAVVIGIAIPMYVGLWWVALQISN